jgi:hypothetical protein
MFEGADESQLKESRAKARERQLESLEKENERLIDRVCDLTVALRELLNSHGICSQIKESNRAAEVLEAE